mgnify:CR=1 FL=1
MQEEELHHKHSGGEALSPEAAARKIQALYPQKQWWCTPNLENANIMQEYILYYMTKPWPLYAELEVSLGDAVWSIVQRRNWF